MQIEVRGHNLQLTEGLKDHINQRLNETLGRFESSVGNIKVRCSQLGSVSDGRDKSCNMTVAIPPKKTVVIEEVATTLRAAVDQALGRAIHSVRKTIDKASSNRREPDPGEATTLP